MRRRGALAVALLGALLLAAPASATWTEPDSLSPDGSRVAALAIGMDTAADTVVVWRSQPDSGDLPVQTSTRRASGALTPIRTVASDSVRDSNLRVAVAPDGSAVIVWTTFDEGGISRVQARRLSVAGVLGPALTLSAPGFAANSVDVGIDANGNAVIAWRGGSAVARVQARALSAAGALSPTQNLSPYGALALHPSVAVAPDGDAVVAWEDDSSGRAQVVARSAAGVVGSAQNLSAPGDDADDVRAAIAPSGDATVTWMRPDGGFQRIQARARAWSGALSPVQNLSAAGDDAEQGRVAVGPDGASTVVWQYGSAGIQVRRRAPGGTLTPVQTLSAGGINPDVADDADGDALVSWVATADHRAWARERLVNGTLGPSRVVSPVGLSAVGAPDVARAPDGRSAVGWIATTNSLSLARADLSVGP